MATESRNALDVAVANLNATAGGRSVFGGVATDRPAMAETDTILAALRSEIAGETTVAEIETRLDAWFDAPGGGFETIAYTGSTTSVAETRLSATNSARLDVRADDPVFRDTLKALSLAALSTDPAMGFSRDLQADMLHSAGTKLLNIQSPLIDLRAGVGDLQARIDETSTQNASEKTSTELARLRLIGVDQYDTAVRLQDAQLQLEALYSVTARAARLSFVEFMR